MATREKCILSVHNLTAGFSQPVINDISFDVTEGSVLGILGESGSGKSVTCLSLTGLIRDVGGTIEKGSVTFRNRNLLDMSDEELREIRGTGISYIFQNPVQALNPWLTVRDQFSHLLDHFNVGEEENRESTIFAHLSAVGLEKDQIRLDSFPGELSGGMCQRVLIALSLAGDPDILIADEPTTGLDSSVQVKILNLLKEKNRRNGLSMIVVTHDLGFAEKICDEIVVMTEGRIVDRGRVPRIFSQPNHPYSSLLFDAVFNKIPGGSRNPSDEVSSPNQDILPVLSLQNVCVHYPVRKGLIVRRTADVVKAVDGVSFSIHEKEILGIAGESGCGKSTLIRAALLLENEMSGSVLFNGEDVCGKIGMELDSYRKGIQVVFQNPFTAMNPLKRVFRSLMEPLNQFFHLPKRLRYKRIVEQLTNLGLSVSLASRFPGTLSGGELQRLSIGRATNTVPSVLLADEPVSSLDRSIRGQVLELIRRLNDELGLSILIVSHDLGVLENLCDRILIMKDGKIVEENVTAALFAFPEQDYTKKLLRASRELGMIRDGANG